MEYTLSYSEQVQGWPSFYSFNPEWMIGMNNYFYTFKGGNLYRHNVNEERNTFYKPWYNNPLDAFTPSRVKSVINDGPLENKLFKTIALQGDDTWAAELSTDIPLTGYVEKDWFEKKEQVWFAFIRDTGTVPADPAQYPQRSVNGIGACTTVSGLPASLQVNFSITPLVSIGAIISIGDYVYTISAGAPVLAGKVTAINQNYKAGNNYLTIDASITGATPPVATDYIMFIKSSVAESHGLLGHYMVFDIENINTSKVELFQVQSNVMKSFP
jgi:hypothetical protein